MPSFEDKYLDVLQNIEMAIVSVYRENHSLLLSVRSSFDLI
jgi:hypothetical protein